MRTERGGSPAWSAAASCPALCLIAAAGLWPAAATAALEPYTLGLTHTRVEISNVYRAASGDPAVDDTLSITALSAGIDQPIGRLRFAGNAQLRDNRYAQQSGLANQGYGGLLRLDGSTVNALSGGIEFATNRNLVNFATATSDTQRVRSIERSRQLSAAAQLGLVGQFSANLSLQARDLDYDNDAWANQVNKQQVVGLGLGWRPRGTLSANVGLRRTEGEYPRSRRVAAAFVADTFARDDLDLNLDWSAGGASRLQARISASRQKFTQASDRDFSGLTGALQWQWQPTGKLRLDTSLTRDTGSETTFYRFGNTGLSGLGDSSTLSTVAGAQLLWQATAKVGVTATLRSTQRRLANSLSLGTLSGGGEGGSDRYESASLGLRYAPMRSLSLGCDVQREQRRTDTTLSYAFDAHTASCYAQLTLQ
jgi:hypothetical protein